MKIGTKPYRPRKPVPKGGRLVQAFKAIDMRCGFDGLSDIAAKEGVQLATLQPGEYVAFFNGRRTILKLATANGVVAMRKLPSGRFYDLTCIKGVVEAFQNTGTIDYDKVLKAKLENLLRSKKDEAKLVRRPAQAGQAQGEDEEAAPPAKGFPQRQSKEGQGIRGHG